MSQGGTERAAEGEGKEAGAGTWRLPAGGTDIAGGERRKEEAGRCTRAQEGMDAPTSRAEGCRQSSRPRGRGSTRGLGVTLKKRVISDLFYIKSGK